MAHFIDSMVYIGQTPRHGLGNYIPPWSSLTISGCKQPMALSWRSLDHSRAAANYGLWSVPA